MRYDLQIIASWIDPGSHVLDLGCGSGELLRYLMNNKKVTGSGIELEEEKVAACIEKGLTVLQGDINEEVPDYPEQTFAMSRIHLFARSCVSAKGGLSVFRISVIGPVGCSC
jgi:methionine biosynthesis protein MetW